MLRFLAIQIILRDKRKRRAMREGARLNLEHSSSGTYSWFEVRSKSPTEHAGLGVTSS
jgi:hypothetical protein